MGQNRLSSSLALLVTALALFAAGCGEHPQEGGQPAGQEATTRVYYALQLPAVRDSGTAVHLRDSLAATGWAALISHASGRWRVRLAVTGAREPADLLVATLGADPAAPDIEIVRDSGAIPAPRLLDARVVSPGTSGMISRLRWTYSPAGTALLIVDDASAIENDPAPAAFIVADETSGSLWQRDSVWDASPSPDWHRVGYSRAYLASGGSSDTLTGQAWKDLADAVGLSARQVRDGAFRASGMSTLFGVSRPAMLEIASGRDTLLPVTGGWRMGWSAGGDQLAVGHAPAHPRDDSPAASWTRYPLAGGAPGRPGGFRRPGLATVDRRTGAG